MKSIFKKNQIVIFTIALMLIVAGYMNYTTNSENSLQTSSLLDSEKYGELGDATLVNSNVISDENVITQVSDEKISNDINNNDISEVSANSKANSSDDQYFIQSRLQRDTMYSQMIDSYQKILDNSQLSEMQKQSAQEEIKSINDKKNAIMISENLIKNKGFEDVIIFINDYSINVIIKDEELSPEEIAQIQNIIQRELKSEIDNIHITNKK